MQGRFEPFASPRTVDHPTVLGTTQRAELPGVVVFTLAGQTLRLTPMLQHGPRGDELLFVFRDRSSGGETYAGGRFLVAAPAVDGLVLLDFNRAHNPPCAFTPYATCPLPLPENRLPVAIAAGEQTWLGPPESLPPGHVAKDMSREPSTYQVIMTWPSPVFTPGALSGLAPMLYEPPPPPP